MPVKKPEMVQQESQARGPEKLHTSARRLCVINVQNLQAA